MFGKIRSYLTRFLNDHRGGVNPVEVVIFIIAIFITGALLPTAMTGFQAANYTNNDATVRTVAVLLLPVIAIVGLALKFLKSAGK